MSQNCARQLNCEVGWGDWPDKALPASRMFVAHFLNNILNSIQYFQENSSKHLRWVSHYSYDNDRFQKCISLITCAVKNLLTFAINWNKLVKWNLGDQTITYISQLICGQSFSFSRAPDNQKHTLRQCKNKKKTKKVRIKPIISTHHFSFNLQWKSFSLSISWVVVWPVFGISLMKFNLGWFQIMINCCYQRIMHK